MTENGPPKLDSKMDHGAWVNEQDAPARASIADLLLGARSIKVSAKRSSDPSAKARSVQATADGLNAERSSRGLPLIEVLISEGGSPAVSTRGRLLTDFSEFAAEWDASENGRGPEGIVAGPYATTPWWLCARGHSWEARVSDRIVRLLRCQRCSTRRADDATSLAAIHPRLLAAWDDESNEPLTPRTIKANYPPRREVALSRRPGTSGLPSIHREATQGWGPVSVLSQDASGCRPRGQSRAARCVSPDPGARARRTLRRSCDVRMVRPDSP